MNKIMLQSLIPNLIETPEWFQNLQHEAQEQFSIQELPHIERVKFHRWPLFDQQFASMDALMDSLSYSVQASVESQSPQIIHVGNQTMMVSVPQDLLDKGLVVMDLFEAMNAYPDLVQEYMYSVIPAFDDKVLAYHTAYLNGGIFIYVPKGLELSQVIECQLIQDARYQQAFNKHIVVLADEHSQVQIMERLETQGELENSATIMVEVIAKSGAKVDYLSIDHLGNKTHGYIKRYGHCDQDAQIDWAIGVLNDGNVILDLDTYLDGDGSKTQVAIVGVSNHKQIQAVDSKVVNRGKHSVGNILQHGVILDQSILTFNGVGLIEKGAKHADAQQESRVLMLSDQARGDANPILLIEEFEVTAGHAASVGQVNQEQLYYLMSRGLTRQAAEHLVVRGFLGPVIIQMPTEEVKQNLIGLIDQKLKAYSENRESR